MRSKSILHWFGLKQGHQLMIGCVFLSLYIAIKAKCWKLKLRTELDHWIKKNTRYSVLSLVTSYLEAKCMATINITIKNKFTLTQSLDVLRWFLYNSSYLETWDECCLMTLPWRYQKIKDPVFLLNLIRPPLKKPGKKTVSVFLCVKRGGNGTRLRSSTLSLLQK